jgi:protein arginine kinase
VRPIGLPTAVDPTQAPAWALAPGEGGIVICARARLARNLLDRAFRRQLDRDAQQRLVDEIAPALPGYCGWRSRSLQTPRLTSAQRACLHERNLISRELTEGSGPGAVAISPDALSSVMVNEEDHLRLQVLRPGLDLTGCLAEARRLDERLEAALPVARHLRYGYLTACPTNLGTGLRASVMLHLPALAETKELTRALRGLGRLHLTARGPHGEGSEASGHLFQVSNQRTLGQDEDSIVASVVEAVLQLAAYETMARHGLLEQRQREIHDRAARALGLLSQARLLRSEELCEQISWLRLGVALELVTVPRPGALHGLEVVCGPGHLGLLAEDPQERDALRADRVRAALQP